MLTSWDWKTVSSIRDDIEARKPTIDNQLSFHDAMSWIEDQYEVSDEVIVSTIVTELYSDGYLADDTIPIQQLEVIGLDKI